MGGTDEVNQLSRPLDVSQRRGSRLGKPLPRSTPIREEWALAPERAAAVLLEGATVRE